MNDQPNNPNREPGPHREAQADALDPHSLCDAKLLRAAADDELCRIGLERLAALMAKDAQAADRVAFEKALRGACGRAMAQANPATCPDALRRRIESICAESSGGRESGSESGPERLAEQTRKASFWAGSRGLMGIAAAMLLTVAGVLVWQSAGVGARGIGGVSPVSTVTYRQQVAEFVTKEHTRIENSPEAAARKFVHTDPEEARAWFVDLLGDGLTLIGLNQPIESIRFKGAGKCGVPGSAYGKSAHMQFEVAGESGEPILVSVFVAPISPDMPMQKGTTYAIDTSACGISGYSVLAWTDGVANYFLVADEGTNGCGQTLKAAGRPEPTEKI